MLFLKPNGMVAESVQFSRLGMGILGSSPVGMAPRFLASHFVPTVRPSNFPSRPPLQTISALPLPRPAVNVLLSGSLPFPLGPNSTDQLLYTEKPQTTVYVGKIASTVEDDFLRSLLELCGPIKSWKRAQDPTSETPKGFGFCEFESADGVLRALRLLNKFSLEGQELVLNVNQATREYLERYVQKKVNREKELKEEACRVLDMEAETAPGVEAPEPVKQSVTEIQKNDFSTEEHVTEENGKKFGIVNNEDKEADEQAQKNLNIILEERARLKPLPPPPPLVKFSDAPGKSNSVSEAPAKSRDGDSVADGGKHDGHGGKTEEETSENKATSELERPETSSSDRGRRLDRLRERERLRDRDRDHERDRDKGRDRERERDRERGREKEREIHREKVRELDRFERDRERERARRERDHDMRIRNAERLYEERRRWWEEHEKERERHRNIEREKEKERERERRREIKDQEEESDDEVWRKRRHRGDTYDERRKRCRREREDDEEDRSREEQEIIDAMQLKVKEEKDEQTKVKLVEILEASVAEPMAMVIDEAKCTDVEREAEKCTATPSPDSEEHDLLPDGEVSRNGTSDLLQEDLGSMFVNTETDDKINNSPAPRKLGFGLVGSRKRTAIPSVFHQEDEDDIPNDRSLRQLVPIDYSAEEMQVVSSSKGAPVGGVAPNLVGAAEFAKSLTNLGNNSVKGELDFERERGKRQRDKFRDKDKNFRERDDDRSRDKDRAREEVERFREREREKYKNSESARERDQSSEKLAASDNRKLLDAKQLIDTIPKTKEDLFAYTVDWAIYDQHDLHERMRPWISKKITEFLGEEEAILVDYIVSNTRKHVTADHMLSLLENILEDEAEMFVLKMWRMLIFEVRKVETGMCLRPTT